MYFIVYKKTFQIVLRVIIIKFPHGLKLSYTSKISVFHVRNNSANDFQWPFKTIETRWTKAMQLNASQFPLLTNGNCYQMDWTQHMWYAYKMLWIKDTRFPYTSLLIFYPECESCLRNQISKGRVRRWNFLDNTIRPTLYIFWWNCNFI